MNPPSPPLRVALAGYGFAGKTFHAPLLQAVQGLQLCAVGSRDSAKVHADLPTVRVQADLFELMRQPQIDLVVIATPGDLHAPLAREALNHGKHVVVDKPFTLDVAEARQLIAIAQRRGVLLSVFHNRRWDSDFLSVQRVIASGAIGQVMHFESHFDRFRPAVHDRWRERAGPGSGVWVDLGPHLIDQSLQLFGLPDTISASLAAQRVGAQTDDWAHVILGYGERRVVLHTGMLVAGGSHRFVAHGTGGSLVKHAADPQEAQLLRGVLPGAPGWGEDPDAVIVSHPDGGRTAVAALPGDYRRYYAGIVDAVAGVGSTPVPPIEALAVMAVLEGAVRSARERAAVSVPLSLEELSAWTSAQRSRRG